MALKLNVVVYALVAVTLIAAALFTVVFVLGGSADVVAGRAAIIAAMLAPVVGVLIALLQGNRTQDLVDGHLAAHFGRTDAEIQAMIDARVRELAAGLPPPPP